MKIFEELEEVRFLCRGLRRGSITLALVPTMGYLHEGHLAHVRRGKEIAERVIATIYVNPTQFAEGEDLSRYPRDIEGDIAKLESAGCDYLYLPKQEEIYPDGSSTFVSVDGLTSRYEGAFRPTHFRGVTTIVAKFLNIMLPDILTLGQKDAQQVAVVRRMMRDLCYGVRLEIIPTQRETDGLAMSSRNVYLSEEDRIEALSISRALTAAAAALASGESLSDATALLRETLSPRIALDYADIIDGDTFEAAGEQTTPLLGVVAGRVGKTRLIDNMWFERRRNGRGAL